MGRRRHRGPYSTARSSEGGGPDEQVGPNRPSTARAWHFCKRGLDLSPYSVALCALFLQTEASHKTSYTPSSLHRGGPRAQRNGATRGEACGGAAARRRVCRRPVGGRPSNPSCKHAREVSQWRGEQRSQAGRGSGLGEPVR